MSRPPDEGAGPVAPPPPAEVRPHAAHRRHSPGHDHDHDHDHSRHGQGHGPHGGGHAHGGGLRELLLALGLTGSFAGVEFAAGWLARSDVLVADAWHMVSDAASLALASFAAVLALRPRSARKTFGYRRLEVLAALANGVFLGVAAGFVVREAILHLQSPPEVDGRVVVAVGALGLAINLLSAWFLHRKAGASVNVRAALAHVLGDAAGSAAAIVAGLVVLVAHEPRADPALSLVVAAILLWSAWHLVSDTAHILMEGTPEGLDPAAVEAAIRAVPGVASVHDLHLWSITSGEAAVTAHVVLAAGGHHGVEVAQSVCRALEERFGLRHATIQPEPAAPAIVQLRRPGDEPR